ncbi:hypothetical protein AVEN_272162-1 [Araneus ventricosus]|uniref:DUF4817 domain-containing protein n=1 Tax=Araneus ventricosus TaxID=182803 RepID=A0A4Y2Q7E5_ARAVE|nr:hypothetical protein AVEN_272162-1 [Araneus ventricosus]
MHGRRASCEPLDGAVMESIKHEFSYTLSFLPWISEGMVTYSNQEKADMHFMYGVANRNAFEAERLYRKRFPRRHVPDRKMFERLHWYLCEMGSFVTSMHAAAHGRSVCWNSNELVQSLNESISLVNFHDVAEVTALV